MRNRRIGIFIGLVVLGIVILGIYFDMQPSSSANQSSVATNVNATPLLIGSLTQAGRGATIAGDNPAIITTPPGRYAYAANLKVPDDVKYPGTASVQIKIKVKEGTFSVGLLTNDASKFIVSQVVKTSSDMTLVTLVAPSFKEVGSVLFANNQEQDGFPSVAEVSAVVILPGDIR